MESGFWHERWERAEIGFHQQEINPHLPAVLEPAGAAIRPAGIRSAVAATPGPAVAGGRRASRDRGGNQSRRGRSLLSRKRFASATLAGSCLRGLGEPDEIRILLGDFFALEPRHLADVAGVYDRASLIALPPAMRERYATKLAAILPAGIRTLLVTLEYDQTVLAGPTVRGRRDGGAGVVRARIRGGVTLHRDALSEESRWRERGLTWLLEKAYLLTRRTVAS
ncbi:MAG: thiopurine S-methyltransferase [Candidatus Moduliflexus flocculans]|nr:thiopurine S-methyltransferase [Candidatus Moduliflexus flocculans]